jgi:hypothetical protein
MGIIINAGCENKGGTFEQAKINAEEWLKSIHEEGFLEVEMSFVEQHKDGDLEIHGFTKEECQKFTFHPRVYWNGSSTADPKIENWLADGFKYRVEYYRS